MVTNIFYAKMTDTSSKIKEQFGSIGARKTEAEIKREYLRRVDKISSTEVSSSVGAATKITAMLAIIWAASSSNIAAAARFVDIASLNVNQLYNHFEFASVE